MLIILKTLVMIFWHVGIFGNRVKVCEFFVDEKKFREILEFDLKEKSLLPSFLLCIIAGVGAKRRAVSHRFYPGHCHRPESQFAAHLSSAVPPLIAYIQAIPIGVNRGLPLTGHVLRPTFQFSRAAHVRIDLPFMSLDFRVVVELSPVMLELETD